MADNNPNAAAMGTAMGTAMSTAVAAASTTPGDAPMHRQVIEHQVGDRTFRVTIEELTRQSPLHLTRGFHNPPGSHPLGPVYPMNFDRNVAWLAAWLRRTPDERATLTQRLLANDAIRQAWDDPEDARNWLQGITATLDATVPAAPQGLYATTEWLDQWHQNTRSLHDATGRPWLDGWPAEHDHPRSHPLLALLNELLLWTDTERHEHNRGGGPNLAVDHARAVVPNMTLQEFLCTWTRRGRRRDARLQGQIDPDVGVSRKQLAMLKQQEQ